MLNRVVVLETPLRPEECLMRLKSNIKPTPGYAAWSTWAPDTVFWGSASAEDFRVQLGRARQLTSAQGRFGETPNGTRITIAIGLKAWVIYYGIFSALALVAIGFVIAKAFGDGTFALVVLVVALVGLGANFAVGLLQERDLTLAIARTLDARQAASS